MARMTPVIAERNSIDFLGKIISYKYKITNRIHDGEFSAVYSAQNRLENDRDVIIKFAKTDMITHRKEDIARFHSEAIAISRLDHPNIVKVFDVGEIEGMHYLVMEQVNGISLARVIETGPMPDIETAVKIIRQICAALIPVHGQEIVHKQLNPGNVLVREENDGTTVTVTNFGFAQIKDFNRISDPENIKETFSYMPPEQSGIINKRIDSRSDLYSLGIIFYRLLTGQLPFKGTDISSIIHQHIAMLPEPVTEINPQVPEILERIVLKLIEKDPEQRYDSALRLYEDLGSYLAGEAPSSLENNEITIKIRTVTPLIGREQEYHRLIGIFDQALNGVGSICLISGEFGVGKSRLVEELISNIYYHRGTFIQANSPAGESRVPYGAIGDALNDYLQHFNEYPDTVKQLIIQKIRTDIGSMGEMIVRFNPLMSEIIGDYPHLVELQPDRETTRFLRTLSQLFYSLSIVEKGIVIILDNLQQLDESSFLFLQEIVKFIRNHPLLVIGLYRDNEIPPDHGLRKFLEHLKNFNLPFEEIRLGPLDAKGMNLYIASMLYAAPETVGELSEFIQKNSRGNPSFAAELLKQLKNESAIARQGESYVIVPDVVNRMEISPSVIDIIINRLKLLSEAERSIISYAAIMGISFDIELMLRLTKYTDDDVLAAVDRAAAMQIIKPKPNARGSFQFTHSTVRETLYRSINPEKLKSIHQTIASILEDMHPGLTAEDLFTLAHHYIESGNRNKIVEYAYPAAIRAIESHANEEAVKYLVLVKGILEEKDETGSDTWIDCVERLGQLYLLVGKFAASIEMFESLLGHIDSPTRKASFNQKISQAYFTQGDWTACESYANQALLLLNETLPLRRYRVMLSLVGEILAHYWRVLFPPPKTPKSQGDVVEKYRVIVNIYMTLNWMYILSDTIKFIRSVMRMLHLSWTRVGVSRETGMSMAVFGSLLMVIPFFRKAVTYHEQALAMRIRLGDQFGIAQSLQFMGYCSCYQGDYDLSLNYFAQSQEIFKRIGDVWETAMVMNGMGYNHFYLGDYSETIRCFREYLDISETINDYYGISVAAANLSLAFAQQGNFDEAEAYGRRALKLSKEMKLWYPHCFANINYGYLMMEKGDYEAAVGYLKTALDLYEKNHFLRDYTVYVYSLLAEASLELYRMGNSGLSKKALRAMCRASVVKTRKWRNHYAAALRVCAKFYALAGKPRAANTYFKKSIQLSAVLGRRHEIAMGLHAYGLFLKQEGKADQGDTRLLAANQIFREIGSLEYVRRVENALGLLPDEGSSSLKTLIDRQRMYSIIQVSQDISSITNLDELLEKVMSVAIEVTGAQRGFLMMVNDTTGDLEIVARKNINPLERADSGEIVMEIVNEVHRTGKARLVLNASEDEHYGRLATVAKYGLKSILCIPLKHKDESKGICYLDNALSGSVFTSELLDVLSIIMTQAAISIEIVRLYELGITDGLTKLATHRHFQDMLQKEINKSTRYGRDLSLIMIDIDHFKNFNDRYGHQAGDEVLKAVSRIVQSTCRDIDIAARYGGEELAMILPETSHDEAIIVAERIRSAVADQSIDFMHKRLNVTISIGVASFPIHGMDRQSLIKSADVALYQSKEKGRNRVTVAAAS